MKFILTTLISLSLTLGFSQNTAPPATSAASIGADSCDLELGPEVFVCLGAVIHLNPHPLPGTYTWSGPPGLSCTDCPSPVLSNPTLGTHRYIATLTRPECVSRDTLIIVVLNGQQPVYNIAADTAICRGQTVRLGGDPMPSTVYTWSSRPPEFASSAANPSVSPFVTTTYLLAVSSSTCVVPAFDSVQV
ncbi:MAG TPA: hypothetical protein PK971_13205, partial [Saprospiraceae bacterium]|nr:hypothetical protein [Saprospiraceae bacterium]